MSSTTGKTIHCRAAVTWSPGEEFRVENIRVAPPQAGEVRVKMIYSSLCHTDLTFWKNPGKSFFPIILGHEGSGVVESVGDGVQDVQPGDSVITVFHGECKNCELCKMAKTNLCEVSMKNLAKSVMPSDQKTRFFTLDGKPIHHFLNCSTFTEYTVMLESSIAKVKPAFPLNEACLLSCGVPTGLGSAWNIAKVEAGSTVAVIGLGTVGLAVVEGAKIAGASRIIAIDIEPSKFQIAKAMGATECINPKDYETPIQEVIQDLTTGGVDYSFECVGRPQLMLSALECCNQYGTSVMVGCCTYDETLTFPPRLMFLGRQWKSGMFGGFKGRSSIPGLVEMCINKEVDLERYITHRLPRSSIYQGFELLAKGACVKCVFHMDED